MNANRSVIRGLKLKLSSSIAFAAALALAAGCGGSGSQKIPPSPNAVASVVAQILDVGGRFELNGSSSTDPKGREDEFAFSWTIVNPGPDTDFEDHCKDDFAEICVNNNNDHCNTATDTLCTSDADCGDLDTCDLGSGDSSDQCSTGACDIGAGDSGEFATFVADVPGPFTVRMVVQTSVANDIDSIVLDTYPSLYVVGSLLAFGGTGGGFIGDLPDASTFASGAAAGASNPLTGAVILIDTDLGVLRRFDLRSGEILGAFGESDAKVQDPVALVFDDSGDLYVAQADGAVKVFDGSSRLLIKNFGNVGAAPKALGFSPTSGNLLVADGVSRAGLREYASNGAALGVLGDTDSDVDEAVDFAFYGDPATGLLVADATGDVVRCDPDGTSCAPFGSVAAQIGDSGPSAIAVNPSADYTDAQVLIADPSDGGRVIACDSAGENCGTFGDTDGVQARGSRGAVSSGFKDIFFAPPVTPTTTSTSTTTTTLP